MWRSVAPCSRRSIRTSSGTTSTSTARFSTSSSRLRSSCSRCTRPSESGRSGGRRSGSDVRARHPRERSPRAAPVRRRPLGCLAPRLGATALAAFVVVLASTAIVLAPWVVRNEVSVGCYAITTDSRALWKANNANTYDVLARGGWIDDVPPLPGAPPRPQDAGAIYGAPVGSSASTSAPSSASSRTRFSSSGETSRARSSRLAAAGGRAPVAAERPRDRGTPGGRVVAGHRAERRRARVHGRPLRIRPRRVVRASSQLRGAHAPAPRLPDVRGDALRGRYPLSRAVGLPHRDHRCCRHRALASWIARRRSYAASSPSARA